MSIHFLTLNVFTRYIPWAVQPRALTPSVHAVCVLYIIMWPHGWRASFGKVRLGIYRNSVMQRIEPREVGTWRWSPSLCPHGVGGLAYNPLSEGIHPHWHGAPTKGPTPIHKHPPPPSIHVTTFPPFWYAQMIQFKNHFQIGSISTGRFTLKQINWGAKSGVHSLLYASCLLNTILKNNHSKCTPILKHLRIPKLIL